MTHGENPAGPSAPGSSRLADTVAILGTGTMGFAMARNIARAGIKVRAWNRTQAKAEPLADDGARVAATPAAARCGGAPAERDGPRARRRGRQRDLPAQPTR